MFVFSRFSLFVCVVWTFSVSTAFAAQQKSQFEKYIDQLYSPKERKKSLASISTIDKKNGFARVTGAFEGYQDYFLFRGKKSDYVASVSYGCGPACSQDFAIYEFLKNGTHKIVAIEKICDFSAAKDLAQALRQKCLKGPNAFSNDDILTKKRCPFVWSFPKKGTTLQMFRFPDGDEPFIDFATTLRPQLTLSWNGSKFIARKTTSSDLITLDEKLFNELF